MFEDYKNRMARRGANMSEMLRTQSNMVIEQTWDRDPNYRRVYVVKAGSGLPDITNKHELVDVKFNVDTYQKFESNEPAYHLQFRHGAEKYNTDIGIGSYVYMMDEDEEWKWWMITGLDERPQFRQYTINECNWKFGWVVDGNIYYHLGILRQGSSMRESDENSYTSVVNGNAVVWMATNEETQLIGHNQRFMISDIGRNPPLCYAVSTISDTMPVGLTKFIMSQSTFDPNHDDAELMLCNYRDAKITPSEPDDVPEQVNTFDITYNGTKASVKAGGSTKVFTAHLPNNTSNLIWSVYDGKNVYKESFGDYTIVTDGYTMKLKIASNYQLIGTVLTIRAESESDYGEIKVEVI